MRKKPEPLRWVRYPLDGDTLRLGLLSRHAELAHRRLAEYHWQTGGWVRARSRSAFVLARCPAKQWCDVMAELAVTGWRCRRGDLVNEHVAAVRTNSVANLRKFAAAGRKGAKRRWAADTPTDPTPVSTKQGGAESHPEPAWPGHSEATDDAIARPIAPQCDPNANTLNDNTLNVKDVKRDKEDVFKALNGDERLTLSLCSTLEKDRYSEERFLNEVFEAMCESSQPLAQTELANWGGWWRNRFREDPDKARRVLAEIRSMIREGRVFGNPGAAATDLWKRLP